MTEMAAATEEFFLEIQRLRRLLVWQNGARDSSVDPLADGEGGNTKHNNSPARHGPNDLGRSSQVKGEMCAPSKFGDESFERNNICRGCHRSLGVDERARSRRLVTDSFFTSARPAVDQEIQYETDIEAIRSGGMYQNNQLRGANGMVVDVSDGIFHEQMSDRGWPEQTPSPRRRGSPQRAAQMATRATGAMCNGRTTRSNPFISGKTRTQRLGVENAWSEHFRRGRNLAKVGGLRAQAARRMVVNRPRANDIRPGRRDRPLSAPSRRHQVEERIQPSSFPRNGQHISWGRSSLHAFLPEKSMHQEAEGGVANSSEGASMGTIRPRSSKKVMVQSGGQISLRVGPTGDGSDVDRSGKWSHSDSAESYPHEAQEAGRGGSSAAGDAKEIIAPGPHRGESVRGGRGRGGKYLDEIQSEGGTWRGCSGPTRQKSGNIRYKCDKIDTFRDINSSAGRHHHVSGKKIEGGKPTPITHRRAKESMKRPQGASEGHTHQPTCGVLGKNDGARRGLTNEMSTRNSPKSATAAAKNTRTSVLPCSGGMISPSNQSPPANLSNSGSQKGKKPQGLVLEGAEAPSSARSVSQHYQKNSPSKAGNDEGFLATSSARGGDGNIASASNASSSDCASSGRGASLTRSTPSGVSVNFDDDAKHSIPGSSDASFSCTDARSRGQGSSEDRDGQDGAFSDDRDIGGGTEVGGALEVGGDKRRGDSSVGLDHDENRYMLTNIAVETEEDEGLTQSLNSESDCRQLFRESFDGSNNSNDVEDSPFRESLEVSEEPMALDRAASNTEGPEVYKTAANVRTHKSAVNRSSRDTSEPVCTIAKNGERKTRRLEEAGAVSSVAEPEEVEEEKEANRVSGRADSDTREPATVEITTISVAPHTLSSPANGGAPFVDGQHEMVDVEVKNVTAYLRGEEVEGRGSEAGASTNEYGDDFDEEVD